MRLYKITWTESEAGWGQRPDGYSFHKTPEAAHIYLKKEYNDLPDQTPHEYSFPSSGWISEAKAEIVEVDDNGAIAKDMTGRDSLRIFRFFDDPAYKEASNLKASGNTISINYLADIPEVKKKPAPKKHSYKL